MAIMPIIKLTKPSIMTIQRRCRSGSPIIPMTKRKIPPRIMKKPNANAKAIAVMLGTAIAVAPNRMATRPNKILQVALLMRIVL